MMQGCMKGESFVGRISRIVKIGAGITCRDYKRVVGGASRKACMHIGIIGCFPKDCFLPIGVFVWLEDGNIRSISGIIVRIIARCSSICGERVVAVLEILLCIQQFYLSY